MTTDMSIAISFEALYAKSKAYIGKALRRKEDGDLEEYQLWASLSLELLGKGALAAKHPCLVVDPTHSNSLFVAAGVALTTDVKTITAKTLFERLKQISPQFDERVKEFCQSIAERRNTELHSGDIPFAAMKIDAWEGQFWHACNVILSSFQSTFEDWMGATEAKAPRKILQAQERATFALTSSKIQSAKNAFEALSKKKQKEQVDAASIQSRADLESMLDYVNDHLWPQECPACAHNGYLAGDQTHEEFAEDKYGETLWESVERSYSADEFFCPVCSLHLTGSDEVTAAGLPLEHSELEERQLEYEPDYGNC